MIESGLDTETFYTEMQNLIAELGDEHSSISFPSGSDCLQCTIGG